MLLFGYIGYLMNLFQENLNLHDYMNTFHVICDFYFEFVSFKLHDMDLLYIINCD